MPLMDTYLSFYRLTKENMHSILWKNRSSERDDDVMVWSDSKHQGSELLCEERESRKTVQKNGEETLDAKSPLSHYERFGTNYYS